jgi:clan AA aspartic protease
VPGRWWAWAPYSLSISTPKTDITVGGSRGSALIPAIIDTGFDGYVCLPVDIAEKLGLELTGRVVAVLADGSEKSDLLFSGWVELLGKRRTAEICLTTDEALIGTGLLADCELSIDFGSGAVQLSRKPSKRRR